MSPYMKQAYDNFQKYVTVYRSSQYINWRKKGWFKDVGNIFILINFLTIIFIITFYPKCNASCLNQHNQLLVFIILPLILISIVVLQQIIKNKEPSNQYLLFQESLCFLTQMIQQYYLLTIFDNLLSLGIILITYTAFYSNNNIKMLSYISYIIFNIILFPIRYYELFMVYLIFSVVLFGREVEQLNEFIRFNDIFNFLEIIPEAMCIFNKRINKLIYANTQFESLASKLIIRENKDNKIFEEFLHNLQLEELQNDGFQIIEHISQIDDEGITDDIYKIKKVIFNKEKQDSPGLLSFPFQINEESPQNNSSSSQQNSTFYNFLRNEQQQILKKAFTSDITLLLGLNHQPLNFIQSAEKKKRKISLSSSKQDVKIQIAQNLLQNESRTSILLADEMNSPKKKGFFQNSISIQADQSPSSSFVQHKLKFIVHIVENVKFDGDDLQVVFLQDLSPLILKTQIKKLEQVKKNLMRSISHDFVTYLNGAYGHLSQARDQMQESNDSQISKNIENAYSYLTLQLNKIYDFQDFQDILNGQFQFKNFPFNLSEAINYCKTLVQNQIQEKKLYIEVQCFKENVIVQGDRQKFQQLLLNLISNSIRYTYQGGITITVRTDAVLEMVEIRVTDTGIGMEQEQLGLLTKKLLSKDDDEKISKNSIGIGMGLIVCKQILKIMGPEGMNTIFAESVVNQGSQFFFYLTWKRNQLTSIEESPIHSESVFQFPVDLVSTENQIQPIKSVSYHQMKKYQENSPKTIFTFSRKALEHSQSEQFECRCNKILIVDDELFNIQTLGLYLTQLGYENDQALNGVEGILQFKKRIENKCCCHCCIYRMVLMDINMPIMDGWDAVKQMRLIESELKKIKRIPIIAVTGFCSPKDKGKCFVEGFDLVINKPATKQKIEDIFLQLNLKKLKGRI